MTSVQMLAAVRVILDESSPDFWSDAIAYSSLADGQNAAIALLLAGYRKTSKLGYELETVLNDDTGTSALDPTAITVPTGFVELISATYDHDNSGGQKPCIITNVSEIEFSEDTTYLTADGASPRIYLKTISDVLKYVFIPTATAGAPYTVNYIKTPTDIASGQNPALPASTHDAIVFYAVAKLLQKDERLQEASYWMNQFNQEIGKLI